MSVEREDYRRIRIDNYVIEGKVNLLEDVFQDLCVLNYKASIDVSSTYLVGKLLSNPKDEFHFCGAILPTNLLGRLCDEALCRENLEVYTCHIYISFLPYV